jgi:hypothetical protein
MIEKEIREVIDNIVKPPLRVQCRRDTSTPSSIPYARGSRDHERNRFRYMARRCDFKEVILHSRRIRETRYLAEKETRLPKGSRPRCAA